jgi:hypothetical protein
MEDLSVQRFPNPNVDRILDDGIAVTAVATVHTGKSTE